MSEVTPAVPGVFVIRPDGEPRLLASCCRACGARAFPPRTRCASCSSPELDVEEAAPRGVVYSWTVVPGAGGQARMPVAQVRLEDGLSVQGYVAGAAGGLAIGSRVRLVLLPRGADAEGRPVAGYAFELEEPSL